MKVAIVIHSMAAGGAERISSVLADRWDSEVHQVHLITIASADDDFYHVKPTVGRHSIGMASNSANLWQGLTKSFARLMALRGLFRRIRPNIVIGVMTGAAVNVLLASRGLGIKVIVSERTHPPCYPLGHIWEWLRVLTYPWSYRVVVQTDETLNWLKKSIPTANGAVIPNPVSFPLPNGAPPYIGVSEILPPEARLLLAVGRLDAGKQFDQVIQAFCELADRHQNWYLVIVGQGPEHKTLIEIVERSGYSDRIRLPGRVGNVSDWYKRADLYVMSSRFEGFPNTLLEAMAHGCAVVCYDCDTGPRDIIRHEVDGLLIKPVGDIVAMSYALSNLMGDESRRIALSCKALEVKERFSPDRVFHLWESVLSDSE